MELLDVLLYTLMVILVVVFFWTLFRIHDILADIANILIREFGDPPDPEDED